jgi:LysR family transcriptional regulator (chromosome initiation inhibitor)
MEQFYETHDFGIKHRIPSTESYLDFIRRGYGWGMVPDIQSQVLRDSQQVVELVEGQYLDIPLYWHIWNLQTQLNQTLTQMIRKHSEKCLLPINTSKI